MGGHRVYNKNIGNEVLPEAQASNRRPVTENKYAP